MTSVDIIGQVVGAILGNHAFSRPAWAFPAELVVMAGIGAFLALALPRMRAGRGAIISAIVLIAWNGAAIGLFLTQGIWLKLVYPTVLFIVGYAVIVSRRFLLTERKKELVEGRQHRNQQNGSSFVSGAGVCSILPSRSSENARLPNLRSKNCSTIWRSISSGSACSTRLLRCMTIFFPPGISRMFMSGSKR